MNLKEVKNSMLYQACEYRKLKVSMDKFNTINNQNQIQPETDLVGFYLGVHILGVVESQFGVDQELPPSVEALVLEHQGKMEQIFFRIFTYLMLISIGETRHGNIHNKSDAIEKRYGAQVKNFAKSIKGSNRSSSRHEFLQSNRNLHDFMRYCDWIFIEGFSGGSYGGPKWKNISNKVTQVLEGEISPFTMTDVAWALVHNTGSIFNKNTIYNSESSSLTHLLDFQRGGAIPSLICNVVKYKSECKHLGTMPTAILKKHEDLVNAASKILGVDLGEYVVPMVIHEAGALTQSFKVGSTSAGSNEENPDMVYTGETINMGITQIQKLKRTGG
ncbi:MAG: hypothetical protein RTU92_08595 [Candidatus Thorarchaeota archaeon]